MAQYFEVLSHGDSNVEQNGQSEIRYILTDDSQQFPAQQLVHLSADQVMVVDGTQQQIQGVVIDPNQIAYQTSNTQFGAVVQNANMHVNNSRQIYYMEATNAPTEGVQTVHAVLDPQIQQVRPAINPQQKTQMVSMISRQLTTLQQQKQQHSQVPIGQHSGQIMPQEPEVQRTTDLSQVSNEIQKNLIFQRQHTIKNSEHDEIEDEDTTIPYRKVENRTTITKSSLLSRLPSNIKITQTSNTQSVPSISQPINQVVNQVAQQQTSIDQGNMSPLNDTSKKTRLPGRLVRPQNLPARTKLQRNLTQNVSTPRVIGPQTLPPTGTRFTQASRYPNQQSLVPLSSISQVNQVTQSQTSIDQGNIGPLNDATKKTGVPGSRPVRTSNLPAKARLQKSPTQNVNTSRAVGPQIQPQSKFALSQTPRFPNQSLLPARVVHQQPNIQEQVQTSQQVVNQQNGAGESQINYLITPPTPNRPRQQQPLPSYIPSSQIQQIIESTPIAEEYSDSIRMLVLLENGEQRLITFTLPREPCTIQEILEQVSVPFTPETNIQVTEPNTNGINYIVAVGNISNISSSGNEDESQDNLDMQQGHGRPTFIHKTDTQENQVQERPKIPTPEPPKELPKLIPGKLAVCSYCGYTGEDFNKCSRCNRKLPENVRAVESPVKSVKSGTEPMKEFTTPIASTKPIGQQPSGKSSPKKKVFKVKPIEESVVISSDEEGEDKTSVNEQLLKSLGASVTISPVTKEPSLTEVKKHIRKISLEPIKVLKVSLKCRTVRIGSYRFYPAEDIQIDSKCVIIKAPTVDNKSDFKVIRIDKGDIVKVLMCFNKSLPVIFYYLNVGAAPTIRELLNMKKETGVYYDPTEEKEDSYRKITLLPEDLTEEHKLLFQQIYNTIPNSIMDELSAKEANDILIKTCPKEGVPAGNFMSFSEIKQILLYPKEGQGRLSINTEDYVCLAVDQFLNDKIIDFYLKYLWENLDTKQQEKVHIFSTFFYKRLTTKPTKAARKSHPFEVDPTLSAAEKRHCRVKNWTKKINIFEKDFIVVPINENAHWFLAIICFPGMIGPKTFDGKLYNPEPKPKRTKKVKKEKTVPCDEVMLSDKDEAESEDSDLESDESEEFLPKLASSTAAVTTATTTTVAATTPPTVPVSTPTKTKKEVRPPIKQPCILIFDSLAGPSRSRVVATLRDYLTVEYKTKMDSERIFNRDIIKGASVKVPQQTNFTDCGLYLLQYVEQFFKDPIRDYYIPIKGIDAWFEEITVTRKREDICNLIKELMEEGSSDTKVLPDIALPTLNGKLVEKQPEMDIDGEHETGEDGQEDMFTDIDDSELLNTGINSTENGDSSTEFGQNSDENSDDKISQEKPSLESASGKTEITSTVMQLKPSLSEFPRQTNKDTLNYLKAKRIIRHKTTSDGPDLKKTKIDYRVGGDK